jgi:anti-anti-sigma factor
MDINVEQARGKVPVTVVSLRGSLDGSNYQALIAKAKELYEAGTRNLLLDMSNVPFMSSAGLVALHSIIKLLRNEKLPDPEAGWEALHAIGREANAGAQLQRNIKLLSPQPKVEQTLELSGIKSFFEILTDRQSALDSFAS